MPHRPLYFLVKPPPDVAALIAALPQAGRRSPDLLHITLLPLGDRLHSAPGLVDRLIAVGGAVEAPASRVVFDRLGRHRPDPRAPRQRANAWRDRLPGGASRCDDATRPHRRTDLPLRPAHHDRLSEHGTRPPSARPDQLARRGPAARRERGRRSRHIPLARWPLRVPAR